MARPVAEPFDRVEHSPHRGLTHLAAPVEHARDRADPHPGVGGHVRDGDTAIASGYNAGPFSAFDDDPVFFGPGADAKMKPFQQVVKPGKWPGWPAPPSKQTAQSQTQFIVADMFAKSLQDNGNGDVESAVKEAESRLKAIFERPS